MKPSRQLYNPEPEWLPLHLGVMMVSYASDVLWHRFGADFVSWRAIEHCDATEAEKRLLKILWLKENSSPSASVHPEFAAWSIDITRLAETETYLKNYGYCPSSEENAELQTLKERYPEIVMMFHESADEFWLKTFNSMWSKPDQWNDIFHPHGYASGIRGMLNQALQCQKIRIFARTGSPRASFEEQNINADYLQILNWKPGTGRLAGKDDLFDIHIVKGPNWPNSNAVPISNRSQDNGIPKDQQHVISIYRTLFPDGHGSIRVQTRNSEIDRKFKQEHGRSISDRTISRALKRL